MLVLLHKVSNIQDLININNFTSVLVWENWIRT